MVSTGRPARVLVTLVSPEGLPVLHRVHTCPSCSLTVDVPSFMHDAIISCTGQTFPPLLGFEHWASCLVPTLYLLSYPVDAVLQRAWLAENYWALHSPSSKGLPLLGTAGGQSLAIEDMAFPISECTANHDATTLLPISATAAGNSNNNLALWHNVP